MCGTCHQYFQRTGHVRPTTAPARRDGAKAGLKYNQVWYEGIRIKYWKECNDALVISIYFLLINY